jgi:hypothetical protein
VSSPFTFIGTTSIDPAWRLAEERLERSTMRFDLRMRSRGSSRDLDGRGRARVPRHRQVSTVNAARNSLWSLATWRVEGTCPLSSFVAQLDQRLRRFRVLLLRSLRCASLRPRRSSPTRIRDSTPLPVEDRRTSRRNRRLELAGPLHSLRSTAWLPTIPQCPRERDASGHHPPRLRIATGHRPTRRSSVWSSVVP